MPNAEKDALVAVLREHRADGWVCTCGWPLTDSVGSVVDHLAEQIRPLMRCQVADPTGLPCRLFPGHAGEHGDGRGVVWTRPIPPGEPAELDWFMCPECKQGKHQNCTGNAWDNESDALVNCECGHE